MPFWQLILNKSHVAAIRDCHTVGGKFAKLKPSRITLTLAETKGTAPRILCHSSAAKLYLTTIITKRHKAHISASHNMKRAGVGFKKIKIKNTHIV